MTAYGENEHDTLPPSMDPAVARQTVDPPQHLWGILAKLGPGLIIAGSIVGSGELIATTKTGAQGGIALLWLIIVGCIIKVFVQIELGRHTITHGETPLSALDQIPGPRARVNWIIWYWLFMMACGLGQLGGIVGGVGQSLALSFPLTGDYARATALPSEPELRKYIHWYDDAANGGTELAELPEREQPRIVRGQEILKDRLDRLDATGNAHPGLLSHLLGTAKSEPVTGTRLIAEVRRLMQLEARRKTSLQELEQIANQTGADNLDAFEDASIRAHEADVAVKTQKQRTSALLEPQNTIDDMWWALGTTLVTVMLLYRGSYGLLQNVSTVLVVLFTFVTVGNVIALQTEPKWRIPASEFIYGLSLHTPSGSDQWKAWSTALATFGIIGVGAAELIAYPYWCLEKGYAKYAGPRSADPAWATRARGWMKVMYYDAFASMIIYTLATLAFFLTGVAVLHNEGRDPDGMRMVSTLATAYVPVFGEYAGWLFLIGAIAVLYSTFLVANAGHARTLTDCLKIFGVLDHHNQKAHN
ncbi:MAG TPA: hypothetical protein VHB77_05550, partial [Planctomycetaceae bacterium]|nr:hypothetical protein [Planctomycetaceae bacterium]